jgi:penicillin amidase
MTSRKTSGSRRRLLSLCILAAVASAPGLHAQTVRAPALSGPGSIGWDAEGVPLIRASTDNDAAYLQGWAHARDRFFQMDLTRRGASGTLAELVGPSVLADDVQTRTIGLRRAALETWKVMSADTRGWLKAYADGVNHWLRSNPLPPEYGPLELTRVPAWEPVDTLVIGKALAFQLSFDLDIEQTLRFAAYQQAAAAGGFDGTALFFGDTDRIAPPDGRVSVPGFEPGGDNARGAEIGNGAKGAGIGNGTPLLDAADPVAQILGFAMNDIDAIDEDTVALAQGLRDKLAGIPLFERALGRKDSPIGSNEWAVAGEHTASGKAIVANDPHLGLDLPSIFIEHHVHSTDARHGGTPLDAVGVSLPGVPGIIQGCNQRICWGTTTNSLDVTDVYQETFRLNTLGLPYATVHGDGEEPVKWVFQSFFVNSVGDGQADNIVRNNSVGYTNGAMTVIVPRRNNGPVLQISGNTGLSVAYAGWGPTFELESFRRINTARNLEQFEEALTFFDFGSQNFVYGDVDGNIAYYTTGEAPIRIDLQTMGGPDGGVPPWFIRNGSGARQHDWMPVQNRQRNQALPYEILPESEMPHVVNPASGYVANANNDPTGYSLDNNALNQLRPGGGIHFIDNGGASAYRMGRIDRELQAMIDSGRKITVDDMKRLQANNQQLDAELVLPHLLQAYANASGAGAWGPAAALAGDVRVAEAIQRLDAWDYSSPTGIREGYDPGDNPASLPQPSQAQIDASVAATIWAHWRSFAVRSTIDATLQRVGLGGALPGNGDAYTGLKFLLDNHALLGGRGASGLDFFAAEGAPDAASARDYVLLKALKDSLDVLASDAYAPAFAGSTNLADYRWGKLHRITFDHPLGGPFDLPGPNPYGFSDLSPQLPGLARPGGYEVVDASGHGVRAQGVNAFMFGSGPARRFVGEMSAPIKAWQILPGGQSGVLGSPHYASQLGRWLTNDYHAMKISAASAAAGAVTTVSFTP